MDDTQKAFLGAIVRFVLLFIAAPLVAHGVVNKDLLDAFINSTTAQIVGGLGAAAVLGWTLIQKWWASRREQIAALAPVGTTTAQLDVAMKKTQPGLIPTGPLPTPQVLAAIVDAIPPKQP